MFKADSQGVNAMLEPLDKNSNPIANAPLVRTRIVDRYPNLGGPQVLDVDGNLHAKTGSTIKTVEYNYIEFGTFPTVL